MNRYLSTIERAFLTMADWLVMNPVVMVRCRGVLPVERIEHALRVVQAKHPALQVRLVRDPRPWFSPHQVGEIPLRIVERESSDTWKQVVVDELNIPIDSETGPLIRMVLVRDDHDCELICTTDHLNADGRSGLFTLRDILRVIAEPSLNLSPRLLRTSFDDYIPTGIADLAWGPRLPDPVRKIGSQRLRELFDGPIGRGLDELLHSTLGLQPSAAPPPSRPQIELVHRRLDVERTQALVEACRAQSTTVLTALVVACADALACADGTISERKIGCVTPIDIRSRLSPTIGDDFGIYAWAPNSIHAMSPDAKFWPLAQRMHRILRAYKSPVALAGMRRLLDLGELYEGTPFAGYSSQAIRAMSDAMMVVSNLGRVSLPERAAGVEIESFGFFAMIPEVDFVLGVQSFRGILELNFAYSPSWSGHTRVEDIADRVEATLMGAIGRPSSSRLTF